MTLLEAIDLRSSKRRYLDTPIEPEKSKALCDLIEKYNKKAKTSITWLEDGSEAFKGFFRSYGMFSGVRSLIVLKGDKSIPDLPEKLGYYGEQLVLKAVRLELGTCWVAGTFERKNPVFGLMPNENLVAVIPVGYYIETAAKKRKRKKLEDIYIADREPPEWFITGMQAVQKAPSAINRQPVMFFCMGQLVFASTKKTTSLFPVDLGIAKAHFEIAANGKFEFGNGGLFTKKDK